MIKALLFDWGNTLMKDFPGQTGPMAGWDKVEAVESSEECLKQLSKTYDCYIATNAEDSTQIEIQRALQRVHLEQYFKGIFCSAEIGFEKPSTEFYTAILTALSLQAHETLFIGDNLRNDVLGPLQHGMTAVLFDPRRTNPYPGLKIHTLLELGHILQSLSSV